MECTVCMELFDTEARRPKTLPCGHSFCTICISEPMFGNMCPVDRKHFHGLAKNLPDNFSLIGLLAEQQRNTYYCEVCDAPSQDACVEARHPLVTLRQLRGERVEPVLTTLMRGSAVAQAVIQALEGEGEDLRLRFNSWRGVLDQFQEAEGRVRSVAESAVAGVLRTLQDVLPSSELAAALEGGERLLAAGEARCPLTLNLYEEGEDGAAAVRWECALLPAAADKLDDEPLHDQAKRARFANVEADDKACAKAAQSTASDGVRLLRIALVQLQREGRLRKSPLPTPEKVAPKVEQVEPQAGPSSAKDTADAAPSMPTAAPAKKTKVNLRKTAVLQAQAQTLAKAGPSRTGTSGNTDAVASTSAGTQASTSAAPQASTSSAGTGAVRKQVEVKLNLNGIASTKRYTKKMEEFLVRAAKATNVTGLRCNVQHAWALQLLNKAAPQLAHVEAVAVSSEQLRVLAGMRGLRSLSLTGRLPTEPEPEAAPAAAGAAAGAAAAGAAAAGAAAAGAGAVGAGTGTSAAVRIAKAAAGAAAGVLDAAARAAVAAAAVARAVVGPAAGAAAGAAAAAAPVAPAVNLDFPALELLHLDKAASRCELHKLIRNVPLLRTLTVASSAVTASITVPRRSAIASLGIRLADVSITSGPRVKFSPKPSPLAASLQDLVVEIASSLSVMDVDEGVARPEAILLRGFAGDLVAAGLRGLQRVWLRRSATAFNNNDGHRADDCVKQVESVQDAFRTAGEPWSNIVVRCVRCCPPGVVQPAVVTKSW